MKLEGGTDELYERLVEFFAPLGAQVQILDTDIPGHYNVIFVLANRRFTLVVVQDRDHCYFTDDLHDDIGNDLHELLNFSLDGEVTKGSIILLKARLEERLSVPATEVIPEEGLVPAHILRGVSEETELARVLPNRDAWKELLLYKDLPALDRQAIAAARGRYASTAFFLSKVAAELLAWGSELQTKMCRLLVVQDELEGAIQDDIKIVRELIESANFRFTPEEVRGILASQQPQNLVDDFVSALLNKLEIVPFNFFTNPGMLCDHFLRLRIKLAGIAWVLAEEQKPLALKYPGLLRYSALRGATLPPPARASIAGLLDASVAEPPGHVLVSNVAAVIHPPSVRKQPVTQAEKLERDSAILRQQIFTRRRIGLVAGALCAIIIGGVVKSSSTTSSSGTRPVSAELPLRTGVPSVSVASRPIRPTVPTNNEQGIQHAPGISSSVANPSVPRSFAIYVVDTVMVTGRTSIVRPTLTEFANSHRTQLQECFRGDKPVISHFVRTVGANPAVHRLLRTHPRFTIGWDNTNCNKVFVGLDPVLIDDQQTPLANTISIDLSAR